MIAHTICGIYILIAMRFVSIWYSQSIAHFQWDGVYQLVCMAIRNNNACATCEMPNVSPSNWITFFLKKKLRINVVAIIRIIQAKWTTARNRATHKNNVYRNINQWSDRYVCVYRSGLFWWRIFLWFRKNNFKFIHFLGHFLLLASPSTIIKWMCWVCVCMLAKLGNWGPRIHSKRSGLFVLVACHWYRC